MIGHWKLKHLRAHGPLKFVIETKACNFEGNYECDYCGRILSNRQSTLAHMKNFHKKLSLRSCDLCPAKFTFKAQIRDHILSHLKFVRFSCELCEFVGKSYYALEQHRQIHSKVHCPICGRPVARLDTHLKQFHVENPRKKCEFCGENILVSGMKVHIRRKHSCSHQCDQCLEKFDDKEYLRRYIINSQCFFLIYQTVFLDTSLLRIIKESFLSATAALSTQVITD